MRNQVPRYPTSLKAAILRKVLKGMTPSDVQRVYGIPDSTVDSWIRKVGI